MKCYIITEAWYQEIKGLVKMENDYHFVENGTAKVQVDVDDEQFIKVSKELEWIV